MSDSVIESYQLPVKLVPIVVWRIDYPTSQTKLYQRGFRSVSNWTPCNKAELREAVENHLIWNTDKKSPFISVFGEKRHAVNWARDWARRKRQSCKIWKIEIEPPEDEDVTMFSVQYLVRKLRVGAHLKASQVFDEYLFLHHIPDHLVTSYIEIDP
ncbi:hypothetical protein CPB86DRAFT_783506 [Serendipita vermifera]|nr:hypothetical protein CPB86DRAFT_783506 [Serendipita vermifera]